MNIRKTAGICALVLLGAAPALAQSGRGDGFLFRPPPASLTVHGGLAAPMARGGVFQLATTDLTLARSDFQTGQWGADLAFAIGARGELVLGMERSSTRTPSESRDFVEEINGVDMPIQQVTRFQRTPLTVSYRYHLTERGRRIGSVAWVPTRFVPFVSAGAGVMRWRFEQSGDFVDRQTLNIFYDQLTSSGWSSVLAAGAGAQYSLNERYNLTGEVRYLRASGDGDAPRGDFAGYDVNLSGVSTLIGLTVRF
jgi:hypothetical protein